MIHILNNKARKPALVKAGVAMGIGILYLFASDFGYFKALKGPIPLETLAVEDYNKQYVQTSFYFSYGTFSSLGLMNEERELEVIANTNYIMLTPNDKLMGIMFWEENRHIPEQVCKQSYEWSIGQREELTPFPITGTLEKMDIYDWSYFKEALQLLDFTEEEIQEWAVPYILKYNYIGNYEEEATFQLMMMVCIVFIYGFLKLFMAFSGLYHQDIKKYLRKNPSIKLQAIEEDFEKAEYIQENLWIGEQWTVYMKGPRSKIIKNEEIEKVYVARSINLRRRLMDRKSTDIVFYMKNGKKRRLAMKAHDTGECIMTIYEEKK